MKGIFAFMKSKPIFWASVTGTSIGFACFVKDIMQGEKFTNNIAANGKIAIVTGANTGIGKETVRELAKRGATVYMACRNMQKCEEAREEIVLDSYNKHIYCRECDLSSLKSIRNFAETFKREQPKLDLLINNAGVMRCPQTVTKDGFELQLGVNHIGHFYLTNLLLDWLKHAAPSRIVVLSSVAHKHGEIKTGDLNSDRSYDKGGAYNQSKLANILFTRELARRLEGSGVTVNAVHPGIVDTELYRHMGFFNNFFAKIICKPLFWPFLKSAKNGAQTTLYVALDPELDSVSGKYFSDCKLKEVGSAAENDAIARWLWAVSDKWTKSNV